MNPNSSLPDEQPKASIGMHVVIDLISLEGVDRLEFDIVADDQADYSHGFLGEGTPVAQAILGRSAHSVIPYKVNDNREIRILSVTLSQATPPADAQIRHEEVVRKALEQSDRTNAMIFASSFSGKWGDYDPTGFLEDENPKPDDLKNPNPKNS
jgi:hypothetical protein